MLDDDHFLVVTAPVTIVMGLLHDDGLGAGGLNGRRRDTGDSKGGKSEKNFAHFYLLMMGGLYAAP